MTLGLPVTHLDLTFRTASLRRKNTDVLRQSAGLKREEPTGGWVKWYNLNTCICNKRGEYEYVTSVFGYGPQRMLRFCTVSENLALAIFTSFYQPHGLFLLVSIPLPLLIQSRLTLENLQHSKRRIPEGRNHTLSSSRKNIWARLKHGENDKYTENSVRKTTVKW
jgi:hypothetical protein